MQNYEPTDRETMLIAAAFLTGFQKEWRNQTWIIESLESDAQRQRLLQLPPEVAKQWEGHTKEQLESNKPYVAIGVGVAFAVRFALEEREKRT